MATVSWIETLPSDDSAVGIGPPEVRNIWTATQTGLKETVYWSGVSFGELLPGASRAYVGAASTSSHSTPGNQRGRLFFASDTSDLYCYAGTNASPITFVAGSPKGVEVGTDADDLSWVLRSGTLSTQSAPGDFAVTFGVTYAGLPYLSVVAASTPSSATWNTAVTVLSTTGATVAVNEHVSGYSSQVVLRWTSLGTVAGDVS